ncbi:hypothetical protein PNA2_0070 [Pyrococcus sp. NA2]|nr:hypothetical protein PNA2_0070 [Pyrococcus sp. NA2]
MKKMLCILIILSLTGFSLGTPYWIEPGVYMKYVAYQTKSIDPTSSGFGDATLQVVYNYSGKLFKIGAFGNSTVTFRVESIVNDTAIVSVEISMEYPKILYSTEGKTLDFSPFWDNNSVIWMVHNKSKTTGKYILEIVLRNLTLKGKYKIDLKTGDVYDLRGRYHGKTILWYDVANPFKINETICVDSEGREVKIDRITVSNISFLTYYKTFKPPIITIKTTIGVLKTPTSKVIGRNVMIYDGSSGILISFLAPNFPDAKAAGFPVLYGFDMKGFELSRKEWKREDIQIGGGLVLLDTNADLIKTRLINYSEKTSKLNYIYLLLLLLFILSLLVKRGER